ncbi:hypothetical protein AB0K00_34260 [Dactylosporangium sp. NPDC049525]|uniref:hypothetical protein n=1 Tax=Dactylosporangium sp. NPDC049525 TaxID=3154730 RepID=UPI003427BCB7
MLQAAFTGRGPGDPISGTQRLVLAALVDNPSPWDPRNGSVALTFQRAGLPFDRRQCRQLCESAARRPLPP